MTEKEKMLAGKIYDTSDKELAAMRLKAHKLSARYNSVFEDEEDIRNKILSELIPNIGKGTYIQGPIQFDYGHLRHLAKTVMQILISQCLTYALLQ